MGVANNHSLAWGIANLLHKNGAKLAYTYQGDSFKKRVEPLAKETDSDLILNCDVTNTNEIENKIERKKKIGFTNNPKYFGKKPSENSSTEDEKKSFGFKGKKKFKSRNSRPKNFTFKKHSQKRVSS